MNPEERKTVTAVAQDIIKLLDKYQLGPSLKMATLEAITAHIIWNHTRRGEEVFATIKFAHDVNALIEAIAKKEAQGK